MRRHFILAQHVADCRGKHRLIARDQFFVNDGKHKLRARFPELFEFFSFSANSFYKAFRRRYGVAPSVVVDTPPSAEEEEAMLTEETSPNETQES